MESAESKPLRPLTSRQSLLADALINNPELADSDKGRKSGYSEASVVGGTIYKTIQQLKARPEIQRALLERGINEHTIAKTLHEGLLADKVISAIVVNKDGDGMADGHSMTKDFINVPDHTVRHKFMQSAIELGAMLPDTETQGASLGGVVQLPARTGMDGQELGHAPDPDTIKDKEVTHTPSTPDTPTDAMYTQPHDELAPLRATDYPGVMNNTMANKALIEVMQGMGELGQPDGLNGELKTVSCEKGTSVSAPPCIMSPTSQKNPFLQDLKPKLTDIDTGCKRTVKRREKLLEGEGEKILDKFKRDHFGEGI